MSYTALYRKYRPSTFDDVKGQDHIVTTLRNQIQSGRVGHAYLFCGTRGTGKTTIAKILAKAVNCEHPVNGGPCGECESCRSIASGASVNVIEMDAASNRGIDDIRQLRDDVNYRPTSGKYKVYIIDEAHQITKDAFNALLKTLEEPPEYAMFIFATTEANRVPITILSRCQRYDFHRISVETITERLRELTAAEGVTAEDKALDYIARMADGAMRDALSILDECIAFYNDRTITYENVLKVLGAMDTENYSKLLRNIVNEDVPAIIKDVDEIVYQGLDLSQFVMDFTWYLRNVLLLNVSPDAEGLLDLTAENIRRIKEEAGSIDEDTIMRYIKVLSELSANLRSATNKRVLIEVALIRMTRPQMDKDMNSISERLDRMEKLVRDKEDILALIAARPAIAEGSGKMTTFAGTDVKGNAGADADGADDGQIVKKSRIKAVPEDIRLIVSKWAAVVDMLPRFEGSYVHKCDLTLDETNTVLKLCTNDPITYSYLSSAGTLEEIAEVIEKVSGKYILPVLELLKPNESFEDVYDNLKEYIKMPIQEE